MTKRGVNQALGTMIIGSQPEKIRAQAVFSPENFLKRFDLTETEFKIFAQCLQNTNSIRSLTQCLINKHIA